jgi:S1-C subfamily serine protease
MKAQFTFLTGTRAGQTVIFGQSHIDIGRHPQCALQFDPEKDLDVSSRHAIVAREGELYLLRDLGSTNGTFVNGRRLTGDHLLATRDVIRFGPNGPQLEFTAIGESRPGPAGAPPPPRPSGTVVFGRQDEPPPPSPRLTPEQLQSPRRTPGPGTTTRVQLAVKRETRGLRRTALILFGLVVLLSGAYLWEAAQTGRRLNQQRSALLSQVDSLMQEIGSLSAGSEGLQAALDSARAEAGRLRQQLAAAPTDARAIADLRRRLDAALTQQRNLAGAARLDAARIAAANRDAVALVFVQFANGKVFTGTAFAVQSDPTGGLLVTNKHVVVDSATGQLAVRIGVVFNGTAQNFRADVVKLHPDVDLAVLRASVHRGFPTVRQIAAPNQPVAIGDPAAVLGFPLGVDIEAGREWPTVGAAATLTLGTVSRLLPGLIQLDSYGAQGSSGSPVFDRSGTVIGVVYGGERGSNGRILYGVPARFIHDLVGGGSGN